jgi:hypothetical protein
MEQMASLPDEFAERIRGTPVGDEFRWIDGARYRVVINRYHRLIAESSPGGRRLELNFAEAADKPAEGLEAAYRQKIASKLAEGRKTQAIPTRVLARLWRLRVGDEFKWLGKPHKVLSFRGSEIRAQPLQDKPGVMPPYVTINLRGE